MIKKVFVILFFSSFLIMNLVISDQEMQSSKNSVLFESCDVQCSPSKAIAAIQKMCVCDILVEHSGD